jgi:hypothetical protein
VSWKALTFSSVSVSDLSFRTWTFLVFFHVKKAQI